jgi:hypothetical protein
MRAVLMFGVIIGAMCGSLREQRRIKKVREAADNSCANE